MNRRGKGFAAMAARALRGKGVRGMVWLPQPGSAVGAAGPPLGSSASCARRAGVPGRRHALREPHAWGCLAPSSSRNV